MPGDGAPAAELTYEQAVAELESVVVRLEGGELPLEEALGLFERGVGLARHCAAQLDGAERQVELLSLDEEGRPVLRPLPLVDEGA